MKSLLRGIWIPDLSRGSTQRGRDRADDAQASGLHQDMAIIAAAIAYSQSQRKASNNHQPQRSSKWKTTGRAKMLNRIPPGRAPQFNE